MFQLTVLTVNINWEWSENAEGVLAVSRKTPSFCIYGNYRQHIKSLRMVVETSDINKLFYFLNLFLNDSTQPWRSSTTYVFYSLGTVYFSGSIKFRQFLTVVFIITFDWMENFKFWWHHLRKISFRSIGINPISI